MDATTRIRSIPLYILLALLVFLGLGGIAGGFGMLMDPSGQGMGLDVSLLDAVPVDDFVIPGLILLIVFGALLMLWIGLEFLMWGNASPLQPLYLALSFAILIFCSYGSVKRYAAMGEG